VHAARLPPLGSLEPLPLVPLLPEERRPPAVDLGALRERVEGLLRELGLQLDSVKEDLSELEKDEQLKMQLEKQVEEQRNEAKTKIGELTKEVMREQSRYREFVSIIKKEKEELDKEKSEAESIEQGERLLNKKLTELKSMMGVMEKKVSDENLAITNSEAHIERLSTLIDQIKTHIEDEKSIIEPLISKSIEQEKKVLELQDNIVKKIAQKQKNASNVKSITKKLNEFFNKKLAIMNLVDKVDKDRDELEKSLIELIRKAKSFQLTSKTGDTGKDIADLEKKFDDVNKKKAQFEAELKDVTSLFRK